MEESLEDVIEAFNLDAELAAGQDVQEIADRMEQDSRIQTKIVEKSVVRPYNPAEEDYEDQQYKLLFDSGTQLVLTISYRPKCPSCEHMASDPEKPHNLQGNCGSCNTQTCPACTKTCDACGTTLCDDCTNGDSLHYVDYETLCNNCIAAVEEEIRYRRSIELHEQRHADRQDRYEQALDERQQLFEEQWKQKKLRHQFLTTVLDHQESQSDREHTGTSSSNEERSAFRRQAMTARQRLR
jgi:hypothetical protein